MKKISIWKKLNPIWWLGNADDGICGDRHWFHEHCKKCNIVCKLKWFMRNPFHNFVFYVIGFADHPIVIERGYTFWNPKDGWNLSIRHPKDYPYIKLPFISYKKNGFEWYIGWRERGNFGIAMRRHYV